MLPIILLFLFSLLPGALVLFRKAPGKAGFRFLLTFSGAYLLTLICSHLLPDLFVHGEDPHHIGSWVVLGLFGQMLLEGFTKGVEHGHMHLHNDHGNAGSAFTGFSIIIALSVHALVEGSMLVQGFRMTNAVDGFGLLAGILVHKVPASIALAMILSQRMNPRVVFVLLLLFSSMSPLGLALGDSLHKREILSNEGLQILYGLASGSLLYISFTIIFEARKDHGFRLKETLPAILGALAAFTMNWGMH